MLCNVVMNVNIFMDKFMREFWNAWHYVFASMRNMLNSTYAVTRACVAVFMFYAINIVLMCSGCY